MVRQGMVRKSQQQQRAKRKLKAYELAIDVIHMELWLEYQFFKEEGFNDQTFTFTELCDETDFSASNGYIIFTPDDDGDW